MNRWIVKLIDRIIAVPISRFMLNKSKVQCVLHSIIPLWKSKDPPINRLRKYIPLCWYWFSSDHMSANTVSENKQLVKPVCKGKNNEWKAMLCICGTHSALAIFDLAMCCLNSRFITAAVKAHALNFKRRQWKVEFKSKWSDGKFWAAKSHLHPALLVLALGESAAVRKAALNLLSFVCSTRLFAGWRSFWRCRMDCRNGSTPTQIANHLPKERGCPWAAGSSWCLVLVCTCGGSWKPANPRKTQMPRGGTGLWSLGMASSSQDC